MKASTWTLGLALLLASPAAARPVDTASCDGKRGWQQQIVRDAVRHWLDGHVDPEDLISLVQAEHGLVACSPGRAPRGLHTPTLNGSLRPGQLGGLLLANELQWRGLVPAPETGLAGVSFRVRPDSRSDERDAGAFDARGR